MEDFLLEKIDRRRLAKLSNLDYLGLDMVEAGTTLFEVVFIFPSNCSHNHKIVIFVIHKICPIHCGLWLLCNYMLFYYYLLNTNIFLHHVL